MKCVSSDQNDNKIVSICTIAGKWSRIKTIDLDDFINIKYDIPTEFLSLHYIKIPDETETEWRL